MKQQLSKEQENIVQEWTNKGGAMIVEAPAGSGKTRVLTESVRKVLEDTPKENFRIICLTFTVKAAEEMKERLKLLGKQKERTFISNLHTFALHILKNYKHEIGYSEMPHIIENIDDQKAILKEVIIQNPILSPYLEEFNNNKQQSELVIKCLNWISKQKRNLVFLDDDTFEYEDWTEKRVVLYKSYNDQLKNQNLIDFDDLLLIAWRILSEKPQVARLYQRLYKYVLIDEGQDLNYAQYELIKALCGEKIKNILMVGDANQAIHGYAGADKKYMFEFFKIDYNAECRNIKQNYRSSQKVLQAANSVMPNQSSLSNNQHFEGVLETLSFENENQEASFIINKIKEAITWKREEFEGEVTLSKIAILARNRFVFNILKENLDREEKLKNSYFLKKGSNILIPESTFMKIFDLGTRIIANPNGKVYVKNLFHILKINKKLIQLNGISKKDGLDILIYLKKYFDQNCPISTEDYQTLIQSWTNLNRGMNYFLPVLDNLTKYSENLEIEERQNTLLDIKEWRQAWKKYIRNTSSSHKSLADFKRFTALGFAKEEKEDGLTLATIHTTKGLEFDIVFLMGMCDGTFPDYRATTEKALTEEQNNVYVAITRAKRHLYISYPKSKMMPWGSPRSQQQSRFVESIYNQTLVDV